MGIKPTPTLGERGFRGSSAARYADVGSHPVPRRGTLSVTPDYVSEASAVWGQIERIVSTQSLGEVQTRSVYI